jgi:hypothetical protein
MAQERPTFQDADLALRLYDLRREELMRRSRDIINGKFWPRSYEEFIAITKPDHEWNAAYRQVASYWEMVYGMARHGIAHAEYLAEVQSEGLFLFAKIKGFVERYRKEVSPTASRTPSGSSPTPPKGAGDSS